MYSVSAANPVNTLDDCQSLLLMLYSASPKISVSANGRTVIEEIVLDEILTVGADIVSFIKKPESPFHCN